MHINQSITLIYKSANEVILLMITDCKKWHYLAVKKLSALFKGITPNHDGDSNCLNCLHSFRTLEQKINLYKKHDYCYIEMPKENNKILKYKHREKSLKIPFIINAYMECLLERILTCHNILKKSSTTKLTTQLALVIHCLHIFGFKQQNRLDYYRGKDCMKNICKDLKEHATKIANYEKKRNGTINL